MYDPRATIIDKFTDSKISGIDTYGTEYVELAVRERNPEGVISYDSAGLMLLEPPIVGKPIPADVGGSKHKTPMTIKCNMWVRKQKSMKEPDTFLKNIIHTFQTTIRTNQNSIETDGHVEGFGDVYDAQSSSNDLYHKVLNVYAYKYE